MATGPQSFTGIPDFGDLTRLFSEMKFPAVPNLDAFIAASRRNMETLAAANRIALEGAQAVARRHMEIMQQGMTEMTEAMRSFAAADSPQVKAAKQAELLKQAYERAVANIKEIGDLIQRSNAEAMALLNKRFAEAMDEIKTLAQQAAE
jgi:phasin family protein